MHVPASGVWVAAALAPGVCNSRACGEGGLVALGCWSVGVAFWGVVCRFSSGADSPVAGVLPVVPILEAGGCELSCPEAPVVDVVLLC